MSDYGHELRDCLREILGTVPPAPEEDAYSSPIPLDEAERDGRLAAAELEPLDSASTE